MALSSAKEATKLSSNNPEHSSYVLSEPNEKQQPHEASLRLSVYAGKSLQRLAQRNGLTLLECAVALSKREITRSRKEFQKFDESDTTITNWTKKFEHHQPSIKSSSIIVGIVGSTGAGKSSLLNALLDEPRLLPTESIGACIGVTIVISYNHEPFQRYRAEVEFISPERWRSELKVLKQYYNDIPNQHKDKGAQIMWDKLQSVYPKISRSNLAACTLEELISDSSLTGVLGKKELIEETEFTLFRKKIKPYLMSNEKLLGKNTKKDFIPWPLIKLVRLWVQCETLRYVDIIDMSGNQDANRARAAVVDAYVKQCTAIWAVALIIRAIDDQTARVLINGTFLRQLKMDGKMSNITFICSEMDQSDILEVVERLELCQITEINNEIARLNG